MQAGHGAPLNMMATGLARMLPTTAVGRRATAAEAEGGLYFWKILPI